MSHQAGESTAFQRAKLMLRLATFRITDGRLLGLDTGDWSMLLGGFVLAGLLTLFA
jgi:hypothetical protein